ncbi:MAG: flagellar protein [Cereibacter sphaeroides]|uniref:Flagellar protein n=1 Tax=Cereibacter sphaeroides TaxID=1063 RepID=A0A2W5S9F5_CERSP|nr:MAG: flagellar protein [Cereibacter sphaeroides]
MSFSPVVPFGGYAGWAFLKRTMESQTRAFEASSTLKNEEAYFREKIGTVKTAEDLVSDRRLLKVALGAFGLDADINNRFFIRKVLEEGTLDTKALANRLSDKAYRDLSSTFGFGDLGIPATQVSTFADKIIARYQDRQFEIAVGERSDSLRIALSAEREVPALAAKTGSDDTRWYTMMGSAPMRKLFQTAFGLPSSFAAIDIDQQLGVFKAKAEQFFGSDSFSQFAEPEKLQTLLRRYLVLSDQGVSASSYGRAGAALQLLQAGNGGVSGILSLLA